MGTDLIITRFLSKRIIRTDLHLQSLSLSQLNVKILPSHSLNIELYPYL